MWYVNKFCFHTLRLLGCLRKVVIYFKSMGMLRSLNVSRAIEVGLSYLWNLLSWLKGILNAHFETTEA